MIAKWSLIICSFTLGAIFSLPILLGLDFLVGYFIEDFFSQKNIATELTDTFKKKIALIDFANQILKPSPPFVPLTTENSVQIRLIRLPIDYRISPDLGPKSNFEMFGDRVTIPKSKNPSEFNLFFGGSFVFGHGVKDEETLPSFLQRKMPNFSTYNFGMAGGGPIHALALAARRTLPDRVKEPHGKVFFEITDSSFGRIHGTTENTGWLNNLPYFKIQKSGEVGFQGTLATNNPFRWLILRWMSLSVISRFFSDQNQGLVEFTATQIQSMCSVLNQSKRILSEQLKVDQFVLIPINMNSVNIKNVSQCLENWNVVSLHYRVEGSCIVDSPPFHLSSESFYEMAEVLYQYLQNPSAKPDSHLQSEFKCVEYNIL